jgi:membrane protein YqaA with SNARE-associated domain
VALFAPVYDRVMRWSAHRHARWYLAGLSFSESSFFPVPPDVMLAPMVVARPERSMQLAMLTTVASALGGLLGYFIGFFAIQVVEPWIVLYGYEQAYYQAQAWFMQWGFWAVFLAGFSPIPYKIFTITAGALSLSLIPFLIASFIGRGARFFLVAKLLASFGPRLEPTIRKYIEWLGWLTVVAAVVAYLILR